jgi:hypothetical protein
MLTTIGIKFMLTGEPSQPNMDTVLRKIYDIYADFVMKNPFYTPEMPIRCDLFDIQLQRLIKTMQ